MRPPLRSYQGTSAKPLATSSQETGRKQILLLANRCVDLSILLLLFVAPLFLGGRHPVGRLVLIAAALPGTIGLVLRVWVGRRLPLTNFQSFLLLGCLLIPIAQIMPAPAEWVGEVSPGLNFLFDESPPLVSHHDLLQTFSLSAVTTARSLPLLMAYVCIFVFLVSRLESLADTERLLILVTGCALSLAVLALLQAGYDNGKFLWIYDHPYREPGAIPRGPFQNENHLSSLLATILPIALYKTFRPAMAEASLPRGRQAGLWHGIQQGNRGRWLATSACIAIVLTVYATPSRGGAAMVGMAAFIWLGILAWNGLGLQVAARIPRTQWMNWGIALGALAVLGGITLLFQEVQKYSYWRAKIWAAAWAMWKDFPLLGIGIGNHRHVYRGYTDEYHFQTFSTSESSWLQILVETGGVGMLLAIFVVLSILWASVNLLRKHEKKQVVWVASAVLTSLVVSCVHAVGDFPWHIPACLIVVLTLSAVAIRLPSLIAKQSDGHDYKLESRCMTPMAASSLVLVLLAGHVWALGKSIPEAQAALKWDEYKRLVRDQQQERDSAEATLMRLVQETLAVDPNHLSARVQILTLQTAELEKQRFQLVDPQDMAIKILRHSAAIAAICPTESKPYLCAAIALNVLNAPIPQQQRLLMQAQRLRPVDGQIALRRGINALIAQDQQLANEQLGIALEMDPSYREQAVRAISLLFPMDQIIERWHPSRATAAILFKQVRDQPNVKQKMLAGRYYTARLREEAERSPALVDRIRLLDAAIDVVSEIKDDGLLMEVVSRKLEWKPDSVKTLLIRAEIHQRAGAIVQAQADIKRCVTIAPRDERVRRMAFHLDREAIRSR